VSLSNIERLAQALEVLPFTLLLPIDQALEALAAYRPDQSEQSQVMPR
jgi:hypothetical protein